MPQLCTRMQNKAAMPERKTMFFGDKKSLAPQLHKFTKTKHCLGEGIGSTQKVYTIITSNVHSPHIAAHALT